MEITLNGKKTAFERELTIVELLSLKNIEPERVAIEHNMNIISREEWNNIVLKDNDNLEILKFVGGG